MNLKARYKEIVDTFNSRIDQADFGYWQGRKDEIKEIIELQEAEQKSFPDLKQEFEEKFPIDKLDGTTRMGRNTLWSWIESKLVEERRKIWDKAIEICKTEKPESFNRVKEIVADKVQNIISELEAERDKK